LAKAKNKNTYSKDSIETLTPLEFTRHSPGVYCGDTTYSTQLLVEILSNAIDEFRLGHGDKIEIVINNDVVSVRDYGQGFLINEVRDDGKTILEASFSVLNTSGKYNADGVYEGTSLGAFGIGSKISNFLSHYLDVQSWRDGKTEAIHFTEGVFDSRKVEDSNEPTGTYVEWQPSEEFFDHTQVEIPKITNLFKTLVSLCPGLTIDFTLDGENTVYFSANGLSDLVDEAVGKDEIIKRRCEINIAKDKEKLDFILTYTSKYSNDIIAYVNTGLTDRGPHITSIKSTLTRQFNKFFREKGWLKEKEENLSGDDIQEGMYIVFNLTVPNVKYDAQVKTTVVNLNMVDILADFSTDLDHWLELNEKDVKIIADKALAARRAREAAKKARDNARNLETKGKPKFINLPTKLVDAWSKSRADCELIICEGDSAANGLIEARDGKTQAIFPIRGKIISARKATPEKVYGNQEVANIVKALGLDIDKEHGGLIYDQKKLRYGKIIFAADADADGQSIINLLITCFWWLCPELFTYGHIAKAVPPLFRITTKKNEYIYLKDGKALDEYKEQHLNDKYIVSRMKGLGESSPDELSEYLLDPATRNVELLYVSDFENTDAFLEIIMGNDVEPRRDYLLKYGEGANV